MIKRRGATLADDHARTVLYQTERFCSQVPIDLEYGGVLDSTETAKDKAKYILLEYIKDFIRTEEKDSFSGKYILATLHLPYVYDYIMRAKDDEIKRLKRDLHDRSNRIAYLELPWYKKLKNWLI